MKVRLAKLDQSKRLSGKPEYERRLEKLQIKMLSIQQCFFHEKRRGVIAVEGWDAAGKGGMIQRLTEMLDPRGVRVYPIGPPTAEEQGRHYLYRFWNKLPEPGTIAIFDRSWYGRVLVERVEKLAPKDAWRRAYEEINQFEAMLVADGVKLVKLFLHITPEEQLERFAERLGNPYKRWKITPSDIEMHLNWESYVEAAEDMFKRTDTKTARWKVVAANSKWMARLESLGWITDEFSRGVDLKPPPVDKKLYAAALRLLAPKQRKKLNGLS